MQWLKEFRENSKKKFEELPIENSEIFKHQSQFKDFEIDVSSKELTDNYGVELVNSKGLIVKSLLQAMKEDEELIKNILLRKKNDDKFEHLNNATFNSGFLIKVPKGSHHKGVLKINSLIKENISNKIFIFLEKDSKLEVIKEDYSVDDKSFLLNSSIQVVLEDNSELTFSDVQNLNQKSTIISEKSSYCGLNSKINWNIASFGSEKIRSRIHNHLEGDGSSAECVEIYFGNNQQMFDNYSTLIHRGKNTTGRILAKGIFKDKSSSVWKGMIKIHETGKNTISFLASHVMLLSKSAKANAIPGLEIDTDDVKATHAASVSPIDEDKLFYLISRGLSKEDASRMIISGFFDPIIQKIQLPQTRLNIRFLLETKLRDKIDEVAKTEILKELEAADSLKSSVQDIQDHYKYRWSDVKRQ